MSKSHLIYGIFKFHEALFNAQPLGFAKITFFSKRKGRIQRPPDWAALNIFGTLLHAVKMPDISVCGRQVSSMTAPPGIGLGGQGGRWAVADFAA